MLALGWLLNGMRVMLPIPCTSSVTQVVCDLEAAGIELIDEQFERLGQRLPRAAGARSRTDGRFRARRHRDGAPGQIRVGSRVACNGGVTGLPGCYALPDTNGIRR
jgi:hypothetical protein